MACAISLDSSETPPARKPSPPWRNNLYRPEMCEQIQEWYAEGQSDAEVAVRLGICTRTLYRWEDSHPDFGEAMAIGKTRSQAWWQILGRNMAQGTIKGSDKIWIASMRNRFNFAEVVQSVGVEGLAKTIQEISDLVALHKKHERDY